MGVIFLVLITSGYLAPDTQDLPLWVIASSAGAISLGTYSGGWRIMRTLGRKIIHLDPPHAFAAESWAPRCCTPRRSSGRRRSRPRT